ncbi:unnamed protein product, partial [Peniophora sp. CBMAI 1063]
MPPSTRSQKPAPSASDVEEDVEHKSSNTSSRKRRDSFADAMLEANHEDFLAEEAERLAAANKPRSSARTAKLKSQEKTKEIAGQGKRARKAVADSDNDGEPPNKKGPGAAGKTAKADKKNAGTKAGNKAGTKAGTKASTKAGTQAGTQASTKGKNAGGKGKQKV